MNKKYIAIDLKSFYASVECMERGLDPMSTNLVVADASRTTKTICLAVSPSMKAYGISGRSRLFEVVQKIKVENLKRSQNAPNKKFTGKSHFDTELKIHPELEIDYIVAPPQMAHYIEFSTRIYEVYLKYIAPEDIHVYSIDEVFIDASSYLELYNMTAHEFARMLIIDVFGITGITATAGIGTNLYLCKIAMDIGAKRVKPDASGARIAELDEMSYRKQLWAHTPITDFWRVGKGYAKKLESHGIYTMGDVARCSIGKPTDMYNEDFLYKLFGINAELLIDHAWGYEPCTIKDVKAYKPENRSISSGQVLHSPYSCEKARMIVREMTELMALDLVENNLVINQLVLTVGYDIENLENPDIRKKYKGEIVTDYFGRKTPKHAHGTANLECYNSSSMLMTKDILSLYDKIVDTSLLVRRITIVANHVIDKDKIQSEKPFEQLDLFTDYTKAETQKAVVEEDLKQEQKMQETIVSLRKKFGKNAIFKGANLQEGATTIDRNKQIGGHKA